MSGRIGENCSIPCRYPSYGRNCQRECNCEESHCSSVTGCISCPIGFMGNDCKQQCRYPNYGKQCQSFCNCTTYLCDHIGGCNVSKIENNSNFDCDKPCSFEDHGVDCHLKCTCSQHLWDNLTGCNVSNFEDGGLLSNINFYDLRTAVIILGVIAIVFSLSYACTYLRTYDGQNDCQTHQVHLVINRDPIYANIVV